ncbi:uncharacterized protein LOC134782121 [Penaeus indicus]|uniref:uncharacterized protein LOC134782121 n=1 Tax=Penaeus indicus TaxID=29960 RepID=UPI00300CB193
MNILVLLSLAGVAACSTSLIGADRARDVELQYTFVNDAGKEVRVEVEAERLGLSLRKQPDSELDVEKEVISDGEEASPVDAADAPAAKAAARPRLASAATSVVRSRLPQAKAAPRTRLVQAAPRRQVETRFVQVGAVPAPQPEVETRFVQVPAPRREVETRFVQVEAVPPPRREVETRFVHVPVSQPEVETRFVQVEAVPEPYEVETRFVQVEAVPAPRREVETRFVQVDAVPAPRSGSCPARWKHVSSK